MHHSLCVWFTDQTLKHLNENIDGKEQHRDAMEEIYEPLDAFEMQNIYDNDEPTTKSFGCEPNVNCDEMITNQAYVSNVEMKSQGVTVEKNQPVNTSKESKTSDLNQNESVKPNNEDNYCLIVGDSEKENEKEAIYDNDGEDMTSVLVNDNAINESVEPAKNEDTYCLIVSDPEKDDKEEAIYDNDDEDMTKVLVNENAEDQEYMEMK